MGKREDKMEKRISDTCELMAALVAYQAGGKDRDILVRRIRLMAGVTMETAARYYDSFEKDGVLPWRYKAIESVGQLIGGKSSHNN